MSRSKRKLTAEQTLAIIDQGHYEVSGTQVDLAEDIRETVEQARLLRPEELKRFSKHDRERGSYQTSILVTNETTLSAASRLAKDAHAGAVLALNFASAKNPGGGFLNGSQAQEESIARASALYPTLTACFEYYEINRAHGSALYTDHMIYSPCVPVFRGDDDALLIEPYLLSVLTAPAANAGAVKKNRPHEADQIESVMRRRIDFVLHIAAEMGHVDLVLGAWGCGVFRNDPVEIAGLFAEQLLSGGVFEGVFRKIVFAVLDSSLQLTINSAFADAFEGVPDSPQPMGGLPS